MGRPHPKCRSSDDHCRVLACLRTSYILRKFTNNCWVSPTQQLSSPPLHRCLLSSAPFQSSGLPLCHPSMLQPRDLADCPASPHPNSWVSRPGLGLCVCVLVRSAAPFSVGFHGLTLLSCLRVPGKEVLTSPRCHPYNHGRTWHRRSSSS